MKPDTRTRVFCSWLIPDETRAPDLAAAYATAFTSEAGMRVLDDLQMKFGPQRPRFPKGHPACPLKAAITEGEANVLLEVLAFIQLGRTYARPTDIQPNQNPTTTDTKPCSASKPTLPEATPSPDTTRIPVSTRKAKPSSPTKSAKSSSRRTERTTG